MIPWLAGDDPFPPVSRALTEPNGLLAAGGELSRERLIAAYAQGIFPWYQQGEPILWWSPNPRIVLFPGELKISRSLAKTLRKKIFEVRMDTAFEEVIASCARRNGRGTWITPEMRRAYVNLHRAGYAHSVEAYLGAELAGGLYGVALGRAFFGESMFYRVSNASKVALVCLMRQLERWEFGMMDCQMETAHLVTLGSRKIPRSEFTRSLKVLVNYPARTAPWSFDHDVFE